MQTNEFKFQLYQIVYLIEWADKYYPNPTPYKILSMSKNIVSNLLPPVFLYKVCLNESVRQVEESHLYATYEECVKECERLNKVNNLD